MTNLDLWNTVAIVTTSLLAALLVYVWTAIALGAVFRKSGEPAWKGWVPFLNIVVLLRLGGLSGWLVLLFIVPIAGWIALIVAAHRVNLSFGYGGGMTVLAWFLFPVWASIVGFGPERWVGRETSGSHGPLRSPQPEAPASDGPEPADAVTAYAPIAPPPAYGRPAAAPSAGWTPPPLPPRPADAPVAAAPPAPVSVPQWTSTDAEPRPEAGAPSRPEAPVDEVPPASAAADTPPMPMFVRRSSAPVEPFEDDAADDADDADEPWNFDIAPGSATSEVTGAISGAPAPVSAAPMSARRLDETPEPVADVAPPVTRVPSAADPGVAREPWAPAPSPVPTEGEAFPESSGPVSAIAGAPAAGGPRSARTSVSALHPRPHIPEEDELEETIVARRKRTAWTLVGPTGTRIPLTSETVIVGRRPVRDPEFPDAQLVSLDDDTRTISKTHARLELRDDRWFITDLDSTNGVLFATLMGTEIAAEPGEATEAGEKFLLGDAEVSLSRSDS
ncbi:DUF5684 domain-containing protein [Microbacterium sp. NPDC019599]|uniref:DUF5684 domain-containing protein n=1 Tax=Microbacterium sp. NPDC019599 TaxID=3154690 RepID=UPI0033C90E21